MPDEDKTFNVSIWEFDDVSHTQSIQQNPYKAATMTVYIQYFDNQVSNRPNRGWPLNGWLLGGSAVILIY